MRFISIGTSTLTQIFGLTTQYPSAQSLALQRNTRIRTSTSQDIGRQTGTGQESLIQIH
jgi:hypothetical protein